MINATVPPRTRRINTRDTPKEGMWISMKCVPVLVSTICCFATAFVADEALHILELVVIK
jgi:hypothetical protein